MSDSAQPVYLVNAYTEPVVIQINGKANYMNCNSFREFIHRMTESGKRHFVIDFANCEGMDSTFLGILAGAAMNIREASPPGAIALARLTARNEELIRNLGLHRLVHIDKDTEARADDGEGFDALDNEGVTSAKNMLQAHENLVRAESGNAAKFQDVVAFLKNQVEEEEENGASS